MTRLVCPTCNGWIDCGQAFASWDQRQKDFQALHTHPAGAPQVYRWPGTDASRDAYTTALDARGLVSAGYAPLGGSLLVAYARNATGDLVRIVARAPSDLAPS